MSRAQATADTMLDDEHKLLSGLRQSRRARRAAARLAKAAPGRSLGDAVSDWVASTVGSWRFIIIQSVLLVIWMTVNVVGSIERWDPYPFILLNLVLSFQAAYTAPIIMMSQNRQSAIDRAAAEHDYEINTKAELEIELLHQKVDLMREQEIQRLVSLIEALSADLAKSQLVGRGLTDL